MKKQLTVKNVFFALCAALVSLVLACSVALGLARTGSKVSADDGVTTTATTTARTYQGQDNWYYLTGDFEADTLYRAYWNYTHSKWQGYASYTNWIDPMTFNKLMPFGGTDAVMAYVVPDYGTMQIVGRVVPSLAASSNINASIVWAHAEGGADTVLFTQNITTAVGEQVDLSIPAQTVKAGDVIYFVASEGAVAAWDGIIFDAMITVSEKQSGYALGNALTMSQMPMTGAHTITVTGGVVDHHAILTDSMKVTNSYSVSAGNTYACLLATDMTTFAWLEKNTDLSDYYPNGTTGYSSCSTGIQVNRVFYSNDGWTGHAGMMYYAPADGNVSILGKIVVNATATARVYKLDANATPTLVTTIEAGEKDLASVAAANNIQVKAGEAVAIVFVAGPWQTSSAAMAFDFCAAPTVNAETYIQTGISFVGASVRYSDPSGLRFGADISADDYTKLINTYGEENVQFGMLLYPTVGLNGAELTHNTEYVEDVVCEKMQTLANGTKRIQAVLLNIPTEHNADEITARVYVAITVNGDTTYYYGDTMSDSLSSVATRLLEAGGLTTDEEAFLNELKGGN